MDFLEKAFKSNDGYFEIDAVSNSFLSRVEVFFKLNILERFKKEDEGLSDSIALFIGNQVHLAFETNGESLKYLVCMEEIPRYTNLTPTEKKICDEVIELGMDAYYKYYNNATTRKLKKAKEKGEKLTDALKKIEDDIVEKIIELHDIASSISARDESYEGKIILNNLEFISEAKAEEVFNKINSLYNEGITNADYLEEFSIEPWQTGVYMFHEAMCITHRMVNGKKIKCKSLIDLVKIDTENKVIKVLDYKTHSRSYLKSAIDRNHPRQISWYGDNLKMFMIKEAKKAGVEFDIKEYKFEYYVFALDTENLRAELYKYSDNDIECGKDSGFITPTFFPNKNISGELSIFCTEKEFKQIEDLMEDRSIADGRNYKYGWSQLLSVAVIEELI